MLDYANLTPDQTDAIDRLYENNNTLLVAGMGSGKTVVALTAIAELLADKVFKRVLVVAPVKVCNSVWPNEPNNWGHLQSLQVANAAGPNEKKRIAALESDAPIVCINFENLPWLFRTYKCRGMFDGLVVDEITRLKSGGGAQFKSLRPRLKDFKWRVGMTGTPVSEDWKGLYAQMMVVDAGERLGTRKDVFMRRYFYPTDFNEYNWEMHPESPKRIAKLVSDIVYTLPDYRHELPKITVTHKVVDMPEQVRITYEKMCEDMVLDMGGSEVLAESAAVLSNKLLQCASGFLYALPDDGGDRITHELSDFKMAAVVEQVKEWRAQGEQVCIVYWFGADLNRLIAEFGDWRYCEKADTDWNAGRQDILMLHPRSAGHGLNLAKGGCKMVFVTPIWSRDLFTQTIARLWRRGQKRAVDVVVVEAAQSIDQLVSSRVDGKEEYEKLFKQHLGG